MARPMQQARGSNVWRTVSLSGILFCRRNWRRLVQVRGTRECSGAAVVVGGGVVVCCLLQERLQAAAAELEEEEEEKVSRLGGCKVQGRCDIVIMMMTGGRASAQDA